MTKLYELTDAYGRLLVLAEEAEDGEWLEALAGLQGAIEEKVESTLKVIRMLEGDAGVFKAEAEPFQVEADRLMAHARTRQRRATNLKDYIKDNLEAVGMDKLKVGSSTVALQNNSKPTCKVLDATAVPLDYWRFGEPEVDKSAITEHFQATGEQVPGAEVVLGRHLRIR